MIKNQLKTSPAIQIAAYLLFFCLSVFYFFYFAGYIFFYQEKSMLFQMSVAYLAENIKQPGGFLVWLAALQTTIYYYPLAGALIVSAEICCIILLIAKTGKKIYDEPLFFLPFLAGAVTFYLQTKYQFQAVNLLGVLMQLAVFYLIVSVVKGNSKWALVLFFPVWYFFTGSFSFVLMVAVALWLIFSKEKNRFAVTGAMILSTLLFILLLREFMLFDDTGKLLFFPYANQNVGNQQYLFLIFIVLLASLPILFRFQPKKIQNIAVKRMPVLQFSPFLLLLIFGALTVSEYDTKDKHYFEVEKLFYQRRFDEVIAYNEQFPSSNVLTGFLNNVALAETGRLTDRLFSFTQSTDGRTLFLPWELSGEVLKRGGYFYYALGLVNEAQRWAYEYMVMRGLTPEGLKMLIKTELINGNNEMAKKYISLLKQTVFYAKEARRFELMLNNNNGVLNDAELAGKIGLKARHDFFVIAENPAANIDLLLAADSTNRVAVQYKFAMLLLQKDFEQVARHLPLLKKSGFQQLPKNIEEAVVAYSLLNLGKYPEFEGFKVKHETVIRFNEYYQIFQKNAQNKEKAEKALHEFADTYWFYVFFR